MSAGAQVDYAALAKQAGAIDSQSTTPIQDKTTIGPQPQDTGMMSRLQKWSENVANDVKYGTDETGIGTVLKKMGAHGVYNGNSEGVGDFMASLPLGLLRATKGVAETGQGQAWQGTKDIVGGAAQAATMPASLAVSPAGGEVAEGASGFLSSLFKGGEGAAEDIAAWQKANTVLGVKPSAIRLGEQATGIEQAATNPGRTLVRLGLDADKLAKMEPIERQAAIAPELRNAGKAIGSAIDQATQAGTKLDIGKSTFQVLKQIKSPQAQQQAVDALSQIQHELGIENLADVTPAEAKQFRDALSFGARFNIGGDLSSIGAIRTNLQRAASRDLENAVPGLDKLNEAFSDLKGAAGAARSGTAASMVKPPPPTLLQKTGRVLLERGVPAAVGAGAGGAALAGYRTLRQMAGGE